MGKTPSRSEIREQAQKMYQESNQHLPSLSAEDSELQETGVWQQARNELMTNNERSQCVAYAEELANDLGFRLIPEKQFNDPKTETVLEIPFDVQEALRSGFYITGTTGSGKSDIGMYLADRLMRHGIIVIVFDSTQDWLSRSSVPYCTTIQRNTPFDIILDSTSMIYDIHKLNALERQQLIETFSMILYQHQASKLPSERRQYFIIFEEAHIYFYQNSFRSKKAQNTVMLLTEGRNYNVRFGCICQFSSMIDKNAMRYMRQRYYGFTVETNDVRYLQGFLSDSVEELKTLQAGEFLFSDATGKITKVTIQPYENTAKPERLETTTENTTTEQGNQIFAYFLLALLWISITAIITLVLR